MIPTAELAQLICLPEPGWNDDALLKLTENIVSSLSAEMGMRLSALDYTGIENPADQRTPDFLWVRFRSVPFSKSENIIAAGGAVAVFRTKRAASGFIQDFVSGVFVRSLRQSEMLTINLQLDDGIPTWEIDWQSYDFIEEFGQYTYNYFESLGELTP